MHPRPNLKTSARWLLLATWMAMASPKTAQAVILFGTGDTNANTSAPTGSLTNSGWQFQGLWGAYTGTAISQKHFLTASHFGGVVGMYFVLDDRLYQVTSITNDPLTDLRICRVCGRLPRFAPIYGLTNETGKALTVFGRGTQRGAEIRTGTSQTLRGWLWGPSDNRLRWGQNTVSSILKSNLNDPVNQGKSADFLEALFSSGGAIQATLSDGDSGGGVFIQDSGVWKVAGINYSVDGPYNTTNSGAGFNAAIFDARSLYEGGAGNWTAVPGGPVARPASFYATRISVRLDWINSVLNAPDPGELPPILQTAALPEGPYQDAADATYDSIANAFTIPVSSGSRFFRVRDCWTRVIRTVESHPGSIVLRLE